MSHEIDETNANIREIMRLRGLLAAAEERAQQAEQQAEWEKNERLAIKRDAIRLVEEAQALMRPQVVWEDEIATLRQQLATADAEIAAYAERAERAETERKALVERTVNAERERDDRGDAIMAAYAQLRTWHDQAHSRNRPPDLNCTGCAIWPVIVTLATAMGFDPLEWPTRRTRGPHDL